MNIKCGCEDDCCDCYLKEQKEQSSELSELLSGLLCPFCKTQVAWCCDGEEADQCHFIKCESCNVLFDFEVDDNHETIGEYRTKCAERFKVCSYR